MEKNLDFNQIYKQYNAEVLNYVNMRVRNIDIAKDIHSEVFTKVYEFLEIFDGEKAQFKTWLYTIVNRKIIDNWRTCQRKHNNIVNVSDYVDSEGKEFFEISDNSDNSKDIEHEEMNEKIITALNKLKPNYKKVAELFFIQELKYTEIAQILEIPLNTVKVNLLRAKEMLQGELKNQYELINS